MWYLGWDQYEYDNKAELEKPEEQSKVSALTYRPVPVTIESSDCIWAE